MINTAGCRATLLSQKFLTFSPTARSALHHPPLSHTTNPTGLHRRRMGLGNRQVTSPALSWRLFHPHDRQYLTPHSTHPILSLLKPTTTDFHPLPPLRPLYMDEHGEVNRWVPLFFVVFILTVGALPRSKLSPVLGQHIFILLCRPLYAGFNLSHSLPLPLLPPSVPARPHDPSPP